MTEGTQGNKLEQLMGEAPGGSASIITPPKKRGPGRPPKADSEKRTGEEAAQAVPGTIKSKAGRPPGKKKRELSGEALSQLSKQVQGLHALASMATGIPELQLGDKEAEMLSQAMANVSAQYDLKIDGKTGAFIQLAGAMAMIYLPRLSVIKQRIAARKAGGPMGLVQDNADTSET